MLIAYIPLLFALAGLLMYALCANAKLANIGLWVFVTAFHVTMMTAAHVTARLG